MANIGSGILLIAGTAIGAGMLALPIQTAALGFFPSITVYLICWVVMTISALYLLLVNLAYPSGTNLIRMAENLLGKSGKWIAWLTYLCLLYALCAAYLSGLADWLIEGLYSAIGFETSNISAKLLATLLIGLVVLLGIGVVDKINRILVSGLVLSFVALFCFLVPFVQTQNLLHGAFTGAIHAIPLVLTAFGFHIVIPSLVEYLKHDPKPVLKSVLIGSLLPCFLYIVWQWLVMGSIPPAGSAGLSALVQGGRPTADLTVSLFTLTESHYLALSMRIFALTALITSFLGVALSLFDCLKDTLNFDASMSHRVIVAFITLIPPFLFSAFFPNAFILALHLAGIFVAILLGLLPCRMAQKLPPHHTLPGFAFIRHPFILFLTKGFFYSVICFEGARLLTA